jgi:hypothetical protein
MLAKRLRYFRFFTVAPLVEDMLSLAALLRLLLFKNRSIIKDIRAKNHKIIYQRSD